MTDDDGEINIDKEVNYVKLMSGDGFKFIISKEAAQVSGTLNNMLSSSFSEGINGEIKLPEIDGVVLAKVVEYLYYNLNNRDVSNSTGEISEFNIPTEMALEVLVAADFLQV